MTTLARVDFPIDKTPLCALAAERVSEGADRSAVAPLKPSARMGWRWSTPEGAWRLARTAGRKSADAHRNLWVPGSYARYAEQIATVSAHVRGEWCFITSPEQ